MRTETTTRNLYTFDELDDNAKERARDWWRNGGLDYDWWDSVYEDAETVGALMGIDIDRIYFSGFSSQGDGACFEGSYAYKKGGAKAVTEYAPQDSELPDIARGLQDIQKTHFYALSASVKQSGHYMHELCTDVSVYDDRDGSHADADTDEAITELLRDFMRWIYSRLESLRPFRHGPEHQPVDRPDDHARNRRTAYCQHRVHRVPPLWRQASSAFDVHIRPAVFR